jgi:hypothetical protein
MLYGRRTMLTTWILMALIASAFPQVINHLSLLLLSLGRKQFQMEKPRKFACAGICHTPNECNSTQL